MNKPNLEIAYSDDDEEFDVVTNGVVVGSFSGFILDNDTLIDIRDMIVAIGNQFGIEVQMTGRAK